MIRRSLDLLRLLGISLLAGCSLAWAPESRTQENTSSATLVGASGRLDSGSLLLEPENADRDLPLVIVLPHTGGTAQQLFRWHYAATLRCDCRLLLLASRGSAADYTDSSAWTATQERYEAEIARDLDDLQAQGLRPRKVVLAGFSLGGDLAWALTLRHPERFDGALVMASRMSYRNEAATPVLRARQNRFFLTMGEDEQAARVHGMERARDWLTRNGIPQSHYRHAGGHAAAPSDVFEQGLRELTAP